MKLAIGIYILLMSVTSSNSAAVYISQGSVSCIEMTPQVISVDHGSTTVKDSMCGHSELSMKYNHRIDTLQLRIVYNQQAGYQMNGEYVNSCYYTYNHSTHLLSALGRTVDEQVIPSAALQKSTHCPVTVTVSNDLLKLTSQSDSSLYYCVDSITVANCHQSVLHNIHKRGLSHSDTVNDSSQANTTRSILLSIAVPVVVCLAVVASLFASCCGKNKKKLGNSSTTKTIVNNDSNAVLDHVVINNHTCSSKGSNETMSIVVSSISSPGSPEAGANDPPYSPVYVDPCTRPTSLNIPILHSTSPVNTRHSSTGAVDRARVSSSSINTATGVTKDHTYSVLEVTSTSLPLVPPPVPPPSSVMSSSVPRQSTNSTIEPPSTPPTPRGKHNYFILDINTHEGSEPTTAPVITPDTPTPSDISPYSVLPFGGRIYHVMEPLSSDTDKHCSVCDSLIKDEPDSLYLVILPDDTPTSKDTAPPTDTKQAQSSSVDHDLSDTPTTENEPIYQVLEDVTPSAVICQSCLYDNDNDHIYSEVEKLPDHVYDHVKLFRQDTSLSDHIYMSLEVPDPQTPTSSRKRYLKEIRMKTNSTDVDSAPNTPTYARAGGLLSPLQVVNVGGRRLSQRGQLYQIIESLKKRVDPQERRASAEGTDHTHPSPTKSLGRSMSYCTYTPPMVIEALHKRDGTYHKLNVDSLWEFQQEHRYAPVSIILRNKGRKGMRGKRIKSLMTRGSMMDEDLSPLEQTRRASDYEVPVDSHTHNKEGQMDSHTHKEDEPISKAPVTINETVPSSMPEIGQIPPPRLINRMSQVISRQTAIELDHISDHQTLPTRKMSMLSSLSTSEPCISSFDDDDYDILSPIKAHPTSPNSRYSMGRRAMTAPTLRPYLLYGKKDSDDYEVIPPLSIDDSAL